MSFARLKIVWFKNKIQSSSKERVVFRVPPKVRMLLYSLDTLLTGTTTHVFMEKKKISFYLDPIYSGLVTTVQVLYLLEICCRG